MAQTAGVFPAQLRGCAPSCRVNEVRADFSRHPPEKPGALIREPLKAA